MFVGRCGNFFWIFEFIVCGISFSKSKESVTECSFFQLNYFGKMAKICHQKNHYINISTRRFRYLQWKWASKEVGGSSSFFDLDWLGKPLTIISFGSWRALYMIEHFSWYWQSTAPWHFSSTFLLENDDLLGWWPSWFKVLRKIPALFSYCVRALEWGHFQNLRAKLDSYHHDQPLMVAMPHS